MLIWLPWLGVGGYIGGMEMERWETERGVGTNLCESHLLYKYVHCDSPKYKYARYFNRWLLFCGFLGFLTLEGFAYWFFITAVQYISRRGSEFAEFMGGLAMAESIVIALIGIGVFVGRFRYTQTQQEISNVS